MQKPTPIDEEIVLDPKRYIVSETDEKGRITFANDYFIEVSGYSLEELIGKPHSIVRHPDMPKVVFKHLWSELKEKNEVYAFIKNLTKDGSFYWVLAYVRGAFNPDGTLRNYVSTRKTMSQNARSLIEPLYQKLLEIENSDGIEASEKELIASLNGRAFNDVMIELQN